MGFTPPTLALSWTQGWLATSAYSLASSAITHHAIRPLPTGLPRLTASLPVLVGNSLAPWIFDPATHTMGTAVVFVLVTWVASFRLLLPCWGAGPYTDPWVSARFARFAAVMAFPLRVCPADARSSRRHMAPPAATTRPLAWLARTVGIAAGNDNDDDDARCASSWLTLAARAALKTAALAALLRLHDVRYAMGPLAIHALHSINLFLLCTAVVDALGALAIAAVGVDLEPVFDKPFLAASFREFWARRWNLLIGGLLRESIYEPVTHLLLRGMRKKTKRKLLFPMAASSKKKEEASRGGGGGHSKPVASVVVPQHVQGVGVMASFFVSGVMHEAAVYYLCYRVTGEMLLFFVLHGAFVVCEAAMARTKVRSDCHRGFSSIAIARKAGSIVFTVGITLLTAQHLFFAPILRYKIDVAVVEQTRHALGQMRSS